MLQELDHAGTLQTVRDTIAANSKQVSRSEFSILDKRIVLGETDESC